MFEIGMRFQTETCYTGSTGRAGTSKTRPASPVTLEMERVETRGGPSFWEITAQRRSRRRYGNAPMPSEKLFQMLWASQGITGSRGERAAPSAGALYPVQTYVTVHSVQGLDAGLYRWNAPDERLVLLERDERIGDRVAAAALEQSFIAQASVCFIWTAVPERAAWKYRDRALRYFYLDAGHICQAVYMSAAALGCGACAVGAFYDDMMNDIVCANGRDEFVIYACAAGPT